MKTKKSVITGIVIIIAIAIVLNIISDNYSFRLDFTADKRYTLSDATINILKDLKDPVTVIAYFSEDLPPDVAKTRKDFQELLIEYANVSGNNVVYKFVNPNEDEESEKEAMQKGIGPVLINVRDKDQVKQQKAFLGALIQIGDRSDVIPFMQPGAAMEYALSSSIKKLSVKEKPNIGIIQGHGEPELSYLQQVNNGLSVLYNVEEVTLSDSTPIDAKYKTIVIVAPTDSFSPNQLGVLDAYLANGGNLLLAINRVNGNFQTVTGESVVTGLEQWLQGKNITVGEDFVVDAQCGNVTVNQQQGFFQFQTQVPFPYLPLISTFADHPAVKGIERVVLQFASSITYKGDTSRVHFTPLLMSSNKSAAQQAPLMFNVQKQWTDADFTQSNIPVAGLFSGKLAGENHSRMIVISDGDFAINGNPQQPNQLQPDNVNLMVNSIDFLTDDTGLIELRTKGVTSRPLDQLEDSTKTMLKFLNFLLPLFLVIIYGIIRMQIKRNQRVKRMEENYV